MQEYFGSCGVDYMIASGKNNAYQLKECFIRDTYCRTKRTFIERKDGQIKVKRMRNDRSKVENIR